MTTMVKYMEKAKIELICVALEGEHIELAAQFAAEARRSLAGRGLELLRPAEEYTLTGHQVRAACQRAQEAGADAVLFLTGTWILADHIVDAVQSCSLPVGIWGVPEPVSFSSVGANVVHGALEEMGLAHRLFYGAPGEAAVEAEIVAFARAAHAFGKCRRARLGLIGGRAIRAYPTAADPNQIKALFGMEAEHIDQLVLLEKARSIPREETERLLRRVRETYGRVDVPEDALARSVNIYAALSAMRGEYRLDLLSVKCLGEFMDAYGCCCLALSMLGDEGFVAGCQCSVNAAISAYILAQLSELPPYFGDVNVVLQKEGVARLINCGSIPGRLAEGYADVAIVPQYEYMGRGGGACTLFCCREGDVTFGTLGRVQGEYVMSVATGRAFAQPMEALTPVRTWAQGFVKLNCDPMEFFANIRSNHSVACYGNVAQDLREFCRIANVRLLENGAAQRIHTAL